MVEESTEMPYIDAQDWNSFMQEFYPKLREDLYSWQRPGLRTIREFPGIWGDGECHIYLPISALDLEKEREFKEIFIQDVENVRKSLESYNFWDVWRDTYRVMDTNARRALTGPLLALMFGGLAYTIYGLVGGVVGAAVGYGLSDSWFVGNKNTDRKRVANGLEKIAENVVFHYVREEVLRR